MPRVPGRAHVPGLGVRLPKPTQGCLQNARAPPAQAVPAQRGRAMRSRMSAKGLGPRAAPSDLLLRDSCGRAYAGTISARPIELLRRSARRATNSRRTAASAALSRASGTWVFRVFQNPKSAPVASGGCLTE